MVIYLSNPLLVYLGCPAGAVEMDQGRVRKEVVMGCYGEWEHRCGLGGTPGAHRNPTVHPTSRTLRDLTVGFVRLRGSEGTGVPRGLTSPT